MKFFARRAKINCLRCRYARMYKLALVVLIRAYPRNPRFFIPITALKIFAARKETNF